MPSTRKPAEYLAEYASRVGAALEKLSAGKLDEALALLERTIARKRRVYVGGNGGSAAIADHLCCDWHKGTHVAGKPAMRVQSLTANSALFTALANDFGYEQTLSFQLETLGEEDDVAVLISSSGNSPNVVKAAEKALEKKMHVIALTGFAGGKLAKLATISLHVPVNNYGMAEDAHQMIMHTLAQVITHKRAV